MVQWFIFIQYCHLFLCVRLRFFSLFLWINRSFWTYPGLYIDVREEDLQRRCNKKWLPFFVVQHGCLFFTWCSTVVGFSDFFTFAYWNREREHMLTRSHTISWQEKKKGAIETIFFLIIIIVIILFCVVIFRNFFFRRLLTARIKTVERKKICGFFQHNDCDLLS